MAYGPSISCHFHGGVLFHETCDQLLSQQVEIKIKTLKNWGLGKSEHVYWTILDSMLHSWMDIVPSAYPIISHPSFDSQFILGLCWIEASGVSTFLNHHVCCLNPTESDAFASPPEGPPDGPPGSPTLARSHWNSQAGATARTLAVAAAFHWFRVGKIYRKPSKI